jgi:2-oxoglutarate ferredoxin oxidoreductase subunit gamma
MKCEIIVAGFGGQGVLLAGTLIAQAALEEGLYTTWFPSYKAEMRGGTVNSTIVVSDGEIGSPIALSPNALIALNESSLNDFMPKIVNKDDTVVIANASVMSKNKELRVKAHFMPLTEIADREIKNTKVVNMIAIGALIKAFKIYLKYEKCLTLASVLLACEKIFFYKQELIGVNKNAIRTGFDLIN